ncbi:hypothetical protein J6590_034539 [Homalodisca vitripennis]|nr:hypothetical protein J6590_034539 [Homalodisca vitripennis]
MGYDTGNPLSELISRLQGRRVHNICVTSCDILVARDLCGRGPRCVCETCYCSAQSRLRPYGRQSSDYEVWKGGACCSHQTEKYSREELSRVWVFNLMFRVVYRSEGHH